MKILITGTAGFTLWNKITDFNAKHYSTGRIGFHLAKRLLERGDTVVGINRPLVLHTTKNCF
jgi:nucleoside-diphosphate-sugar epimerase